jgi:CheY-like chemotaxis protein
MSNPLRAVVVDDDRDARFLLRRALQASGRVEVVGEAADGRDAVDVAARHQPDLVLLDINMPEVDGLTALPRVRAVCPADTVVVVMSALPPPDAGSQAVERGAAGLVEKHWDYGRFVDDVLAMASPERDGNEPWTRWVRWTFPPDLTSGRNARRQLRTLLDDWELEHLRDSAELLATELINNAVVHAESGVDVVVRERPAGLRVEVSDRGAGSPHRPETSLSDTHGRGLLLVESMSDAWGTAVNGSTKTIWFEVSN